MSRVIVHIGDDFITINYLNDFLRIADKLPESSLDEDSYNISMIPLIGIFPAISTYYTYYSLISLCNYPS